MKLNIRAKQKLDAVDALTLNATAKEMLKKAVLDQMIARNEEIVEDSDS